jgi:excisionase family DNA binding protein
MNDHRNDDGAKVVIVLQPVTDTINTALRTAGYWPDAITPDCVVYRPTGHRELEASHVERPQVRNLDNRWPERAQAGPAAVERRPAKLLLTPDEAAAVLSIGRTKLYQLMKDGVVASVLIGGSRRIPSDALTRLVAELDRAGSPTLDDRSRPPSAGPVFLGGGNHVAVAGKD